MSCTHPRLAALLLLAATLLSPLRGADAAQPARPVPDVGTILHDLRDFLPSAESQAGKPDDPIPAFSVRDDGYWRGYRSYNTSKSGYLSRAELTAAVGDLIKQLREHYPDTFSAIDTDGDETITNAKLQAFLHGKH